MIQRFPTRSPSKIRRVARFVWRMVDLYPFEIFLVLFIIACLFHVAAALWSVE